MLASLLISTGIGSWFTGKTSWTIKKITTICGGILLVVLLLLTFGLNALFYGFMHLALPARMLLVFLVIAPVGLLLGTFFPIGLTCVRRTAPAYIPWAWGINGCSSVYGSFAAILIAISGGFTASLLCGVLLYLMAILAALKFEGDPQH